MFCYLAEELRAGDVAVLRSNEYADWSARLLLVASAPASRKAII